MATHAALAVSRIPVTQRLQSKSAIHSFPAQCSSKKSLNSPGLRMSSIGGEASFFDAVAAQIILRGETVAKLKVAITVLEGLGRNFLRCWHGRKDSPPRSCCTYDSGGVKNASHLLKYDSMLGTFKAELIKVVSNRDPLKLPWAQLGIDIVIEGTGVFVDGPGAGKHIQAGASKVIITAPAKGADILPMLWESMSKTMVMRSLTLLGPFKHASCTTNCLAPFAKKKGLTAEDVNEAFRKAANGPMKGILDVCDAPLVSVDFRCSDVSTTIDSSLTMVMGDDMVKVVAWYDNEWGYSQRVVDLAHLVASKWPGAEAVGSGDPLEDFCNDKPG
ncbi:Glyceraldehyde-3-phosphate dehydrogenase GAPB [Arabidopsis thaliana]